MAISRRIRILLAAVALTTAGVLTLSGCAPEPDSGASGGSNDSRLSRPIPTGTVGAAFLDDGYLQVGEGPTTVDLYFDPMCPICGTFEEANGELLAGLVDESAITYRLHPMTFLNRASQGTNYSTRAGNALTCVATADPSKVLPYLDFLYANQPEENSEGLTDETLIEMADATGVPDITECVTDATYASWVQQVNDDALAGPIEGADIDAVKGTPTVLVNGESYKGDVDDEKALADFIAG
jgi:protein-disulfide isomerase